MLTTGSNFYLWRRTIAERNRKSTPAFVPVVIKDTPRVDGLPIEICLAAGRRVRVRAGCDRTLLADVLAVLEGRSMTNAQSRLFLRSW